MRVPREPKVNSNMLKSTESKRLNIWSEIGLPSRGSALFAAVHSGLGVTVLERLADVMALNTLELSKNLGISASTFRRRKAQGRLSISESDRLVRAIRVFDAVVDVFEEDVIAARDWLRAPARGLGGQAPLLLIRTSVGTAAVLDQLGRLEHGVFT